MKKKKEPPFTTVHGLAFEVAPWHRSEEFMLYRVGTCHGTWRSTLWSYEILNVVNDNPGNGHFDDLLQWFEFSCRRDEKLLRILFVWNTALRRHLLEKRGFSQVGDDCVKKFTKLIP